MFTVGGEAGPPMIENHGSPARSETLVSLSVPAPMFCTIRFREAVWPRGTVPKFRSPLTAI